MVILKTHSKREPSKFVGANVPQGIYSYFALYALAKGVGKSELMRTIMEGWIRERRDNEIILINEVVQKIKFQWKSEQLTKTPCAFSGFKTRVKVELTSKGVDAKTVEIILKELE